MPERTAFVIDDDAGVRRSLCLTLASASLRAEGFGSAEEFLEAHPDGVAGCLVLDLRLNGMSGVELLQHLRGRRINTPVIVITGHGDIPVAVHSMKLGAVDFLEKPVDPRALVKKVVTAIEQHEGRQAREDQIAGARKPFAELTERELEMLRLLAGGRSSKQIAEELGISVKTVENHRTHLLAKTQAENIAHLIRLAVVAHLV